MSPPLPTIAIPTVTLPIAGEPTVCFNLATLERIEEATEMNVGSLMERIRELAPQKAAADGTSVLDAEAAAQAFSVRFMCKFLSGALGVTRDQLAVLCPPARVLAAFMIAVGGFCAAVGQLYGANEQESPEGNAGGAGAAVGGGGG